MILGLTAEQKQEDFAALCRILDENYPFWQETARAGINKEGVYKTYREEIANTRTDIEFFKYMGYFLKEFKGFGHLSALDGYMYRLYTDTLTEGENLLSAREKERTAPLCRVLNNLTSRETYGRLDQSHRGFRSTAGLKEEYKNNTAEEKTQPPEIETSILDR